MLHRFTAVLLAALLFGTTSARADSFGTGTNAFQIEFVPIGDPGNVGDPTGSPFLAGAVEYNYRIGKFEISETMIDKANAQSSAEGDPLGITIDSRGPDKPVTSVSWFEAAQFVNWLNTSTGSSPAYKFDDQGEFQLWEETDAGFDSDNLFRNKLAKYVLPSSDEWYKAAYYDADAGSYFDYPTGSNSVPDGIDFVDDPDFDAVFRDLAADSQPNDITNVGILSPYGTAGQGGNVSEWQETTFDLRNETAAGQRKIPGGSWGAIHTGLLANNSSIGTAPRLELGFLGIRVASIPEPNSIGLLGMGLLWLFVSQRRFGNE